MLTLHSSHSNPGRAFMNALDDMWNRGAGNTFLGCDLGAYAAMLHGISSAVEKSDGGIYDFFHTTDHADEQSRALLLFTKRFLMERSFRRRAKLFPTTNGFPAIPAVSQTVQYGTQRSGVE